MKLIKHLMILIVGLAPAVMFAQGEKYSRLEATVIGSQAKKVPANMIKTDFNGDTLGVALVTSSIGDLKFDGNIFGEVEAPQVLTNGNYVYKVFITDGSPGFKIRSSQYHETGFRFPEPIASGQLWTVEVDGIEATVGEIAEITEQDFSQPVTILKDNFSSLYVDEELIPYNGTPLQLEEGTHYISTRYRDERYDQKVRVKKKPFDVDAYMGSTVEVKYGKDISLTPLAGAPEPQRVDKGKYVEFTGLLGSYELKAKPKAISFKDVTKRFDIGQRSSREFRVDEMVPYMFLCYHGTHVQPFGVTLAGCKRFGWFFSYSTDAKTKIDTPYGETGFTSTDSSGQESKTIRCTSYTLSTGPMIRLKRKFYLQLGGGMVRYLSTSEPKVLTPGFEYKTGISANVEFQLRIKGFFIGAGFTHQFVDDSAYNPDIANQISFTIGIATGI